jgi:superfamily II DNA or RNA helicase
MPRDYQRQAAEVFYAGGSARGGSGPIVLPCGAGKTIVGMVAMQQLQTSTLILSPNTIAVRQWINELLDKTTLSEDLVGEYSGLQKEIRPVTISTYQILTYHKRGAAKGSPEEYPHFELLNARNWGLIIYDEVHLLPAPVFRITAELQARRRLGLTATLVREDGLEGDVFSLEFAVGVEVFLAGVAGEVARLDMEFVSFQGLGQGNALVLPWGLRDGRVLIPINPAYPRNPKIGYPWVQRVSEWARRGSNPRTSRM